MYEQAPTTLTEIIPPTWQEGTVVANGIRQHYWRTGGNGPVLVLLHGFTEFGASWLRVVEALTPAYDCILVDARGHGQSDGPVDGYDQARLTADVLALLAALALDRPVVWGYSNGAATAAQVAAVPDRVWGVILAEPPWRDLPSMPPATVGAEPWPGYATWLASWIAWHQALPNQSFAERLAASQAFLPPGSAAWSRAELILFLEAQAQFNLAVLDYASPMPAPAPWRATVADIHCPLLLLTGDPQHGAMITPPVAEVIVAGNAQRQHIAYAGVGHFLHHALPDAQFAAMIAAVQAFLARV